MQVGTASKMAGLDVPAAVDGGRRAACVARCEKKWRALCRSLHVGDKDAATWFGVIRDEYEGPARFYHTLEHVDALLRLAEREAIHDAEAVALAIFFHDVVYDAKNGGGGANERESAAVFREFAEKHVTEVALSRARRDAVSDWIVATATHRGDAVDADGKIFLDLDMSILAADRATYLRYAANVRREYGHVNGVAWRVGRARFLQSTLAAGAPVFASPRWAPKEAAARRNARAERDALVLDLCLGAGAAFAAAGAAAAALYHRASS